MLGYRGSRCSSSSDRITVASGATWLLFSAISSSFLVSARPQRPNRQYTITHTTLDFVHMHYSHTASRLLIEVFPFAFPSDGAIPHFQAESPFAVSTEHGFHNGFVFSVLRERRNLLDRQNVEGKRRWSSRSRKWASPGHSSMKSYTCQGSARIDSCDRVLLLKVGGVCWLRKRHGKTQDLLLLWRNQRCFFL